MTTAGAACRLGAACSTGGREGVVACGFLGGSGQRYRVERVPGGTPRIYMGLRTAEYAFRRFKPPAAKPPMR